MILSPLPLLSLLLLSAQLVNVKASQGNDNDSSSLVIGRSLSGSWKDKPFELFYYANVKVAKGPYKKVDCLKASLEAFFCDSSQDDDNCESPTTEQWDRVRRDVDVAAAAEEEERLASNNDTVVTTTRSSNKHKHVNPEKNVNTDITIGKKMNQEFRETEQQGELMDRQGQDESQSQQNEDKSPSKKKRTRREPPVDKRPARSPYYMDVNQLGKGRGGLALSIVMDAILYVDGEYVSLLETPESTSTRPLTNHRNMDDFLREKVVQLSAPNSQEIIHPFGDAHLDILNVLRAAEDCIYELGNDIWDLENPHDTQLIHNSTMLGRSAFGAWQQQEGGNLDIYDFHILSFMEVFSLLGLTEEQEVCFNKGIDSFFADPITYFNDTTTLGINTARMTPQEEQLARTTAWEEEELWVKEHGRPQQHGLGEQERIFWSESIGSATPLGFPASVSVQHGVVVLINGKVLPSFDDETIKKAPEGLERFVTDLIHQLVLPPVDMLAPDSPFRLPENQSQLDSDIFLSMGMTRLMKECRESFP